MSPHDEELQKSIEAGLKPIGDDADIQAYHEVFSRLSREPEIQLSSSFSDRIVARLVHQQKQSTVWDFIWLGIGIVLLIASFIVAALMSGFTMNLGFLKNMSGFAGLFGFAVAFIIILNLLDLRMTAQKRGLQVGDRQR